MEIRSPFELLRNLTRKPATIPASVLDHPGLSDDEKKLIQRVGLTNAQLQNDLLAETVVRWDRQKFAHEVNRALEHWLVGAAMRLYADVATVRSPIHNATVWITSDNKKYYKVLSKLLDEIGIEERIFDWAWTTGAFGDLFIGVKGRPVLGVVSIDDDRHPIQVNRVDHEGILIGFTLSPGSGSSDSSAQKLIPPWEFIHCRLLGAKRKRPVFSDPLYSEFATMNLMTGTGTRQITSKYGASLLADALPTYKRLRMAEDSLLLARMTRGITRYIWKLAINHCLAGDTKISLLDGTTPTIQEMAGNKYRYIGKSTWSVNEKTGKLEVNRIKNVKKTRKNAVLVKVHLDNGESAPIVCTPDHRFMLRDGEYKEAQHLQPNDSLMPLYNKISKSGLPGYKLVYDPGDNKWHYEHRSVVKDLGISVPKGSVIHHKYDNKNKTCSILNNDPEMLEVVTKSVHLQMHSGTGVNNHFYGKHHTEEAKRKNREAHLGKNNGLVGEKHPNWSGNRKEFVCQQCGVVFLAYAPVGLRKHCSRECYRKAPKKPTKQGNKEFVCNSCGKEFVSFNKRKYCSRECYYESISGIIKIPREVRFCGCECGGTFVCLINSKRRFLHGHDGRSRQVSAKKAQMMECLLNHKVVGVEFLTEKQDTYDIEMEGTPNFPLASGVFVHNSNFEATNEIIDQIATTLKRARAINTSADNPNYDSKECLRGDTLVRLCSGDSVTIQDIADNKDKYINKYVWTINPETHNIEPKRILNAQKTRRNAQLVRVHLDSGEHVDTTPDHPFMLRDGSFKDARDLLLNESLMPFYSNVNAEGLIGYERIYDPGKNKWRFAHRTVSGFVPKGFCVHHLDYNKLNNDPSNIYICSNHEHHTVFHGKHTAETIEKIKKNQVAWLKDKTAENCPAFAKLMETSKFYNYSLRTEEEIAASVRKQLETKKKNGTLNVTPSGEDNPLYGRTWEDIQGVGETLERRNALSIRMTEDNPAKQPEARAKIVAYLKEHPPKGREPEVRAYITSICECGCGQQFRNCIIPVYRTRRFIHGHNNAGKKTGARSEQAKANMRAGHARVKKEKEEMMESLLNHKVVSVEWLEEREDTYDLTIDGNHNFSLGVGIFVHNSPMGVTEDIFMPVWGDNTNALTFDEIGGKPDIRWIVDIDALRNQLAVTLRTPLQLLGGYVEEASGSLGGDSIEQLDIGFARNARRLQRALKEGIKRLCQIHLAYMNMDPDPALFDVNMSETSTKEEEVILKTFENSISVIREVIEIAEEVDPKVDKKKVFDFLNIKILKLEGFDLDNFQKTGIDIEESANVIADEYKRYPISNRDLVAYLPLGTKMIKEGKCSKPNLSERSEKLFCKRWKADWKSRFENVLVEETKGGAVPHNPLMKKVKD